MKENWTATRIGAHKQAFCKHLHSAPSFIMSLVCDINQYLQGKGQSETKSVYEIWPIVRQHLIDSVTSRHMA